jgi:hypothetical protein
MFMTFELPRHVKMQRETTPYKDGEKTTWTVAGKVLYVIYTRHGVLHRTDGPAFVSYKNSVVMLFYLNGKNITPTGSWR